MSKIVNDGLTRSFKGCFTAVPIGPMATVGVKVVPTHSMIVDSSGYEFICSRSFGSISVKSFGMYRSYTEDETVVLIPGVICVNSKLDPDRCMHLICIYFHLIRLFCAKNPPRFVLFLSVRPPVFLCVFCRHDYSI